MIFYIPWTDELIAITWFKGKSVCMSADGFEIGIMTDETALRVGWKYVGDL